MRSVTATELKNRLGQYLDAAESGPVVVNKNGRPAAAILSWAEYERLEALEDRYWGEAALAAEREGYAGYEETMRFLKTRLAAHPDDDAPA